MAMNYSMEVCCVPGITNIDNDHHGTEQEASAASVI